MQEQENSFKRTVGLSTAISLVIGSVSIGILLYWYFKKVKSPVDLR
jgi:hypothetical protein